MAVLQLQAKMENLSKVLYFTEVVQHLWISVIFFFPIFLVRKAVVPRVHINSPEGEDLSG